MNHKNISEMTFMTIDHHVAFLFARFKKSFKLNISRYPPFLYERIFYETIKECGVAVMVRRREEDKELRTRIDIKLLIFYLLLLDRPLSISI